MSTPLSGGYCGGVPPLPIPNREVKPTCADGTAMQCGRVGSRLLLQSTLKIHFFRVLFFVYIPCGPPATHFLKDFALAGLPQIVPQKLWFPALGESRFQNGLAFPRMAKVISRKVWSFRAWRESFPEWFVACGPPANHFLKVLTLAGFPQLTF